ncbi:MAG: urease accessory protein UreD [Rhodobacteraceae bacterium]|nr:urease accessory protein UreD [Paracoccaceae bacterium]
MFDLSTDSMQRARGVARVSFEQGKLRELAQSGSGKVMLPATYRDMPEAVFLNTAGGLTGGDSFSFDASVAGGALMATTQTAERAYASTGAAANVDVALRVGEGATLFWLPQETILFETSHLSRRTRIDAAPGARVLALEIVVLGRAAMGETLSQFTLRDRRELWCNGAPEWVDALHLDQELMGRAAGLGDARAFATMVYRADDAEDRAIGLPEGLYSSAWDGKRVIRGAAADLWPLKKALSHAITQFTDGALPRVWAI